MQFAQSGSHFSLMILVFKYIGKENADHLINALEEDYTLEVNREGK